MKPPRQATPATLPLRGLRHHPAPAGHPSGGGEFAVAFGLNYRGFLGSCRAVQFAIVVNVFQMQANVVWRYIKQL